MTAPVTAGAPAATTAGTVLGDGTTARTRARSRWRRYRWLVGVAVLLLLGVLASVLPEPRTSSVALAPDNPGDAGARAVAQVLGEHGVTVDYVRTSREAVAAADAGTTLLVTSDWLLSADQMTALAGTEADLVLLEPAQLLPLASPGLRTGWNSGGSPTDVDAACEDPDATAAGTISATGAGVLAPEGAADGDVTLCFPVAGTSPQAYLYATADGDRRVTVIGDAALLSNARVAEAGNAALALRALGRHEHLVWYVPSYDEALGSGEGGGPGLGDLVPRWVSVVGLQLLVVVLVLGLWRGRRLGRVVTEPLPVVVRSAETTLGRARLYRVSRAHGHAAASLRAGTADRCARRLGLPRSADAPAVVDAVSRASGRPADEVTALLYGPPPTSDAGLELLARQLDQLESEVHRT